MCVAALESIGHLQKKIELMWGSPELDVFVSRLIMDSREGARQGLPLEVAAELLFLASVNKVVRAIDTSKRLNLSLREAYRLVDGGDQSRMESDSLDNPLVSRDTVTRQAFQEGAVEPKVRREKEAEGLLLSTWQTLLDRSRMAAYFVIFALVAMLAWPTVSGLLTTAAK